jgi:Leucine-rich repeat (LRR) protein
MTKLEAMNVSHNRLTTFPDVLSRCISLRILDVSLNQLTSFPPDLALQCINLQSFLVDGNPAASSILHQPKAAIFHQSEKMCLEKMEANPASEDIDEERSERSHKRVRKWARFAVDA